MALKIRLRKQGRTNRPFYRLVLADVLAPRDGKYLETLGWYNPAESEPEKNLCVHGERVKYWYTQGAELSEKVYALVKQGAPDVMKEISQMMQEKRAKIIAKRKKRRQKKATAKS